MKQYKGYLMDLDGTTYFGKRRIPTAEQFIKEVMAKKFPLQFVTNNATQTSEQIAQKLNNQYELPVQPSAIYTSIQAMVDYLLLHHINDSIYIVGEPALHEQVKASGLTLNQTPSAQVVVQGLNRQTTYQELGGAVQAILAGATFLVTNEDNLIPTQDGLMPSSGAITSFIQFATKKTPTVMGKPNAPIIDGALARLGLQPDEVLLIGDNYATDITAGINANIDTLLVLTGVTQKEEVPRLPVPPTYVIEDLSHWEV